LQLDSLKRLVIEKRHIQKLFPWRSNTAQIAHFWYLMMLFVSRLYSIDNSIINEYGAVGGMRIGKGNRNTQRKPEANWDGTRIEAVGSRGLTA
jgi:hypothetical protein